MKRSTGRILTTHVGSLIRPPQLLKFIAAKQTGQAYDERAYAECLRASVAEVVARQAEAGVDVPSPAAVGVCVAPIADTGEAEIRRDIANFKAALGAAGLEEGFLPVAAPASVIPDRKNEYYKTEDECLQAIARAMRTEYRAIIDAGLLLQLDDARLAVTFDRMVPPASFEDYRSWVAKHVQVLNAALEGIPEERVRYNVCWGSWPGPHVTDVPLQDIVDLILKVRASAYLIEGANPRHEHEWRVWEKTRLPENKILVPGVISHATNTVEHPELVAERLTRIARLIGPENIMAGTDCGLPQPPFPRRAPPSILWANPQTPLAGP